ncbi:MAG: hypothetical protein R2831_10885 [Chitinophagaceae bacterium]
MKQYAKAIAVGVVTTLIAMVIWSKFIAPMIAKKSTTTPAPTE